MRWLLTWGIRGYWLVKPFLKPRTCLFHESCSRHVYRIGREQGFWAGIRALRRRIAQCRPGFELFFDEQGRGCCLLADGSQVSVEEMATVFVPPFLSSSQH